MALPMNANPLASVRCFRGMTSVRIARMTEIVDKVTPIKIPLLMSIFIVAAFADMTAPANATSEGD